MTSKVVIPLLHPVVKKANEDDDLHAVVKQGVALDQLDLLALHLSGWHVTFALSMKVSVKLFSCNHFSTDRQLSPQKKSTIGPSGKENKENSSYNRGWRAVM